MILRKQLRIKLRHENNREAFQDKANMARKPKVKTLIVEISWLGIKVQNTSVSSKDQVR